MTDAPFSAAPIVIVRIAQPRCGLTFGSAPCTATGAPCFNTFSTCRDPENHAPAPAPLYLYFGMPGMGRPSDDLMILPLLAAPPSTSPARINVSGADRRINPLGIRASAAITFRDVPHSDLLVDPYRAARSYDPIARGTFWSKWISRNTYGKAGMRVSIFEGFEGDALADMAQRVYLCDSIDLSGSETVTMQCRDVLSKAADDKAQAPPVSAGELVEDIAADDMTFQIARAVAGDYPDAGTLRIGDECLTYSAIAQDGRGLLNVTVTARGTDGTTPDDHAAEDRVQECFRFDGDTVDAGLAKLYARTTIPSDFLPVADWAVEAAQHLTAYRLTGLVTEPTAVGDLVGEVLEQTQSYQWWDEERREIRFEAVKPLIERPRRLTESTHLIAGTVKVRDFPERRVSRVWFYYNPKDATASRSDEKNYSRVTGALDLPLEDEKAFGDKAIRKIFARFVNSSAAAFETTGRILSRYKEGSREISFAVSDKDADISVGDIVEIDSRRVQDLSGAPEIRLWIVTSRDVRRAERRVYFTAEDATLAGKLLYILDDAVGDYVGDGSDAFTGAWVSDEFDRLPNGDRGMFIQ